MKLRKLPKNKCEVCGKVKETETSKNCKSCQAKKDLRNWAVPFKSKDKKMISHFKFASQEDIDRYATEEEKEFLREWNKDDWMSHRNDDKILRGTSFIKLPQSLRSFLVSST